MMDIVLMLTGLINFCLQCLVVSLTRSRSAFLLRQHCVQTLQQVDT